MTDLLRAEGLTKTYHDGERELSVLRGLDLAVQPGEAVAIVGMSGEGKSTLLHILGGLDRPTSGRVVFDGEAVSAFPPAKLDRHRNLSLGFVFQFHHLLPEFTALENVMLPALVARRSKAEARRRAEELLGQVGLSERLGHRPAKLSGGEQQRVSLARALVNDPRLVLADEPTGNLDVRTAEKVCELLWESTVRQGRSLVIVTHEPSVARRAGRALRLSLGKLEPVAREELKTGAAGMRSRTEALAALADTVD